MPESPYHYAKISKPALIINISKDWNTFKLNLQEAELTQRMQICSISILLALGQGILHGAADSKPTISFVS